jgi:hypothetical protein
MSASDNSIDSSSFNINATGRQGTSPPATRFVTPSTYNSSIGTFVNRRPMDGNDQAQRTTATNGTNNNDQQAGHHAPNDAQDTQARAIMTVELTDDHTVRRTHETFHTNAQQSPRVPSTRASFIARQMTARDRQDFGLQSDTSQSESTSNNNQSTASRPAGFDLFEPPSPRIPPVAITDTPVTRSISRDDYFSLPGALQSDPPQANHLASLEVSHLDGFTTFAFHASELPPHPTRPRMPRNGTAARSSHPFREASDTANMFDSTSTGNERSRNSDQRPSYSLTDLGLGEPVLDNGDSSQPNLNTNHSNTAERVYASVNSEIDCTGGNAEQSNGVAADNGNGRAQTSPDTPINTPPSVNVSDLRLGPVGDETLATLATLSQYAEDEGDTSPNSSILVATRAMRHQPSTEALAIAPDEHSED